MHQVGWNLLVEGYDRSQDDSAEVEKGWFHRADGLGGPRRTSIASCRTRSMSSVACSRRGV